MKKYILISTLMLACFSSISDLYSNATRLEVEVGGPYDDEVIWIGPGWYYGVWFDSEIEYTRWRRYNHRYHRRHRGDNHWRNRGGHHGGHHGGRHR